jgi:signal transduction histidine kinase
LSREIGEGSAQGQYESRQDIQAVARQSDLCDPGIIVLGPDGNAHLVSARARSLLGGSDDTQVASACAELTALLTAHFQPTTGQADAVGDVALTLGTSGSTTPLHVQVHAMNAGGTVGHVLLVQPAVRQAGLETLMRQASQYRGLAFIARDVGHDLKSVLNVLSLNLALLSRLASGDRPAGTDPEMASRCTEVMRRELKRLNGAIDQILPRSAYDGDGTDRFDLSASCQRLGELIAPRAARQQVEVRMALPDTEVLIEGFPDRMQGALLNLVVNSLKAMSTGGTLDIRLWAEDDVVRLRIGDSGPGISDAILRDLWRPHDSARPAGTGIGLAATRAIVEAHKGRIVYHRAVDGTGACFTMEFPRQATY